MVTEFTHPELGQMVESYGGYYIPQQEEILRYRGVVYRSDDLGETWRRTHEGDVPRGIGYDFCLI